MIILPAIDLKDGAVVRLYKGSFDTVHQVASDPVTVARDFQQAGATWIHMVDLDGARDGVRRNADLVRAVVDLGLQVELGGGIRSMANLEEVFALGVSRAVIGSAAVSNPELVAQAVQHFGAERIAVGIDAHNGTVKTAGWEVDSGLDYLECAKNMESIGVRVIIFTDIETDGMLSGPSIDRLKQLQQTVSCDIVASGGVSCNQDIVQLQRMGMYGAIIGKAYYAGAIDLAQAIEDGGVQC